MKKIFILTIALFMLFGVVACSDGVDDTETVDTKQEETEESAEESKEVEEVTIEVNWDEVINVTKKEVTNPEYFDYVRDVYIEVDEDNGRVTFTAILNDSTSEDVAVEFADTFIRRFSSIAQAEEKGLKGPSNEYLGEVFDHYDISIGVAPNSKVDNQKEWFVNDAIAKGVHRNPKAN